MKNLIIIIVFVCTNSMSFGQSFEISEAPRTKNNGTYNSFFFELPDVDKDQVKKDWEKFMKSYKGKTKYNRKAKLFITEKAKIAQLSDVPVIVYTKILEDKNPDKQISLIVWFDLGDTYVDSKTDEIKGSYVHQILTEYAMSTSKTFAESIVKEEEKRLSKMEKDLKKLIKENKNYHKNIEKAKKSITKNEKNIEVNELDQKNTHKMIESQKNTVLAAKENIKQFNK